MIQYGRETLQALGHNVTYLTVLIPAKLVSTARPAHFKDSENAELSHALDRYRLRGAIDDDRSGVCPRQRERGPGCKSAAAEAADAESFLAPPADPAATAAQSRFVESLRNRRTRSLSTGEREEIATIAADKPNIDLEITFDYNSADISATSLPSVQGLGKALSNANLKGSTFVVAGHTDAAGGETYNQDLSERRADSIKRHLVEKFAIAGADLVTVGYGKSKPKDPNAPMDPANRRVQVVNMASKSASN